MMEIFCKCVRAFNWARFCMSFFSEKNFYWVHLSWLVHSSLWLLGFFLIYLFIFVFTQVFQFVFLFSFLSLCIRFVCLLVWLFVRSFCFYYTENLFEFRFSFNLNYMHTRWKSSSFFPICHALHFANSAWFTRFFLASSARAFRLVCVVCCWCMCKNSKPISYQTRHQQQSALRHVGYTIQSRPY